MKKVKSCISMILVCALFFATSTFAVARSSDQIAIYTMDVTATGNGRIAIMFSVTGADFMNQIGAKSIDVYERESTGWETAVSYDADDFGMTASNVTKYGNTKYSV